MIGLILTPSQRTNKGNFQPKITIGKERENIHEQEHELKFHFFSFFFAQTGRGYQFSRQLPYPHCEQREVWTGSFEPQLSQDKLTAMAVPQPWQNFAPRTVCVEHLRQMMLDNRITGFERACRSCPDGGASALLG